jgi:microcystin-dependent protein
MSEPFLGEIRLFPFGLVPSGWAPCNGAILPIQGYQALFSLLGTVYGGNGNTTFALPDLRGRTPIHTSSTIPLGTSQGESAHTLTVSEIPAHTHSISASSAAATLVSPANNTWASNTHLYNPADSLTPMNTSSISTMGGNQPHTNMQPYGVVSFCIALNGIFPSRN